MFLFYDFLLLYYSDFSVLHILTLRFCLIRCLCVSFVLCWARALQPSWTSQPFTVASRRPLPMHLSTKTHSICTMILFQFRMFHLWIFCYCFAIFVGAHQYFVYIYNLLRKYEFYWKDAKMVYEWECSNVRMLDDIFLFFFILDASNHSLMHTNE